MSKKVIAVSIISVVMSLFLVMGDAPPDRPPEALIYPPNDQFNFRVLVTGGDWWPGVPEGMVNPSQAIAQALDGEMIEGARVTGMIDICDWGQDGVMDPVILGIIRAVKLLNADIVICIGLGGGDTIRLERYGCNTSYGLDSAGVMRGHKDEQGNRVYEPIDPDGPDCYEAPFPLEEAVEACLKKGIPASIGDKDQKEGYGDTWFSTAGSYLCNWEAYGVPHAAQKEGLDFRFVFVHVPNTPETVAVKMLEDGRARASMDLERTIEGIRTIIAVAVAEQTGHRMWYTEDRPY